MKKEFDLSEKRKKLIKIFYNSSMLPNEFVRLIEVQDKEFIKRLNYYAKKWGWEGSEKIKELAGSDLIDCKFTEENMKDKEFNLSEKIKKRSYQITTGGGSYFFDSVVINDVKEFIKLLKEKYDDTEWIETRTQDFKEEIDKLAGSDLI